VSRRLHPWEESAKIEVRLPAGLKMDAQRVAEEVAEERGEGDLSTWLRDLIRTAVSTHAAAAKNGRVKKQGS
jgi:hypothetical protein